MRISPAARACAPSSASSGQATWQPSTPMRWPKRCSATRVYANVMMLGFAWQQGLVPVSFEALSRAIELNGVAVERNRQAFAWGRLLSADPDAVHKAAGDKPEEPETLDAGHRAARRLPDRLSECRLCRPLRSRGRARPQGGSRHRLRDAHRRRGALAVQAHGLQGRIRGRTPAHGDRLPRRAAAAIRGRFHGELSPRAAAAPVEARRARPPAEARLRPLDPDADEGARPAEGACAARLSTSSATRPSGAPSGRSSAGTRSRSRRSLPASRRSTSATF